MNFLPSNHNGGPPLDDVKLHFIQFNIRDILETIRTMPLAERGYYVTALFVMYERMGMLPSDDKMASMAMGIDVRQYRHMKPKMMATGRFREVACGITNDRVQAEITAAVRKIRAKQDAALAREAKKRETTLADIADTSPRDRREISERSLRDRREIDDRSGRSVRDTAGDSSKKPNNFNGRHTTAVPLIDKDTDTDTDTDKEYTPPIAPQEPPRVMGEFDCLNGAAVDLVRFISKHTVTDETEAKVMLRNNIHAFGAKAVLDAFSSTLADMHTTIIAHPYQYLIAKARKAMERQKANQVKPKKKVFDRYSGVR